MQYPEEELIQTLKDSGVDFLCSLPCDRIKSLLAMAQREFEFIPLTREEEGVGICAGAALAGRRPAMIVQSSGVGNMVNALMSLSSFYELPLAVIVSHRGVYNESIPAQEPMGRSLVGLIESLGMGYTIVDTREKIPLIKAGLQSLYEEDRIHFFLLNPELWECTEITAEPGEKRCHGGAAQTGVTEYPSAHLTRYEIIQALAPAIAGRAVVSNLGVPSKELYSVLHQPSNFYMLGSMGMATPIGLGMALCSDKDVLVIDGDGSLLMNSGVLATVALMRPSNLTVVAVDNAAYGSTGNQPTHTRLCVDLEAVARGFGIRDTIKAASAQEILGAVTAPHSGPRFVHAMALIGNAQVPNIPLDRLQIKKSVRDFMAQ